jgi:hypothetical protein
LENLFEKFFKEYLKNEYSIENFKIDLPSENTPYHEKCRNIWPEVEFLLKQYSSFVKRGKIDHEILDFESDTINFSSIPSLLKKKYVYGKGENYKIISSILFSDQTACGHRKDSNKFYDNFYDFLKSEKINIEDIPNYCLNYIEILLENKILSRDQKGYLYYDSSKIKILKELYYNDFISYLYYNENERKIIHNLKNEGLLEYSSTLLSRQEADYFDYYLNKKKFSNGTNLRNKYAHTHPNENHEYNYYILLKLLTLLILKIEDELTFVNV